MTRPRLHFVGFKETGARKDERYWRAARVFGAPDFVHPGWDMRAQREIADGDMIVFATGTADQEPRRMSYSDGEG